MNNSPLRVGVIGTGGMGGRHAMNIAHHTPHATLAAVMDVDTERAAEVAAACGAATVYNAANALIEDPDVDAVVIAAPDRTHAGLALTCLAAGKPVLCEKPLATNVIDALAVVEAEAKGGKRLIQLGFMREFDQAHLQVWRAIHSGELGRPLYFRGTHTNLGEGVPRLVEDVIINSAIHDIHSAHWLLQDRVSEVYTRYRPVAGAHGESCRLLVLNLVFEEGGLAVIEVNPDAGYGYEVRIEVMGERGTVAASGLPDAQVRRTGFAGQVVEEDWLARFDAAYRAEAHTWVQGIRSGHPTGPSAWDGFIAMVVADACIASARQGTPQRVEKHARPALYARGAG